MTKRLKPKEKWSYWRGKCDEIFRQRAKERDRWRCVETGSGENLQTAHIIPAGYMNTRWDFENVVTLKSGRHKYYTHHPIEWKLFINKLKGTGYYEKMEDRAIIAKKWSTEDLKELYVKFETDYPNKRK